MTTPPDDFENDPTGMRDLLRSLPEPGPMPQDVTDRITAALAAEHAGRAGDDRSNVTPLARTGTTARKPGTRRWMQALGGVAAAAVVATVAVVGVNALQNNDAPVSAIPSSTARHSASSDELATRVQLDSTGTNYSGAAFNTQAASMASSNNTQIPAAGVVAKFGSLTNPRAIVECVRSIGGSLLDNPSRIKVDLASYDGKPALIIVVTKGSEQTAFAVSSTCSKGTKPYAAPRSV
ncbi:hypothetical protein [Flexivirga alba]|uniref:Uncharacterized protein n=1 Tax=Flexivirga alba TaxID=702742 RepID=A0ABW2ACR3_9MICO